MKQEYEQWVDFEENSDIQISNFGNVRNRVTNRQHKIHLSNNKTRVFFKTNKKRYTLCHYVYKYFGDGKFPTDRRLYIGHKDKNKFNNRIDNLFLATSGVKHIEEWQLQVLENEILNDIKKIIKFQRPFNLTFRMKRFQIDTTELEQGAMIECFKNLHKLVEGEPIYNFCYKYVKFVYFQLKKKSRETDRIGLYDI